MMPTICKEATTRSVFPHTCSPNPCLRVPSQDYGFDYSDNDEDNEAGGADLENMYYVAKCEFSRVLICRSLTAPVAKKEDHPSEALEQFRAIVEKEKEDEKGDWCASLLYHFTKLFSTHQSSGVSKL